MKDLRFAFRQLLKSPVFTLTVVFTIALGIGANTSIFTLVHAILLKSLPVTDPTTLVRIGDKDDCCVNGGFENPDGDFDLFSYALYQQFQRLNPEFEQLAAMQSGGNQVNVRRGTELARPQLAEYVSGNYFSTFGISTFTGRMFSQADDRAGAPPVAVMNYATWQSDYGSSAKLVGSTVYIQTQPVTIVGIAPPGFYGDRVGSDAPSLWLPLATEPIIERGNSILRVESSNWLYVVGRMKPNVHLPGLQRKITGQLQNWLRTQPDYTDHGAASLIPKQHVVLTSAGSGIQNMQQQQGKGLKILMAISGLVLLVACANVANLLLARSASRRTEVSVRVALGAARSRLLRQLLTESVLLACLGGAAGIFAAYAGTSLLLKLAFPGSQHLPISATPPPFVLGFAFLLSLCTGVAFGIVPALVTSKAGPAQDLRGANRTTGNQVTFQQKALIVFQAALSLVLLVGAGLLTRGLSNMEHQHFGIQTSNRYVLHLDPAGAGYTPERLQPMNLALEREFGALPGVQHVGLGLYSVLEGNNWGEGVYVEGKPQPRPNEDIGSSWDRVNSQFFEAIGQPILRGRGILPSDTASSQLVAVVNQAFVRRFFPREDPLGRRFGVFEYKFNSAFTIVGVLANAKYQNPREEFRPMFFRPLTQTIPGLTNPNEATSEVRSLFINSITLQFKTRPQNVDALVRRTLARVDPNLTVTDVKALQEQVDRNFTQERLIARLASLFSVLALILASVGLYGITAYQVACRTSEIGLRMALGADRLNVLGMILRGAFAQVGSGILIGIPIAIGGALAAGDLLYQIKSYDPPTILSALAALLIATGLAGLIPARRAANLDPMKALRSE